ncbi:guanylate kinase [Paenibacillus phoenicis]|uniref:Guanylate kinase n=1 Tax=Paenibacillus phoenicis TaxID=554117 RepID=A0ABU5PNT6_9BACL|nr:MULTISPECIES: guanylate kinase [Paenibacillus]MCT2194317.1 guanylate kinase [Paenibacillus sp. p3-SID1389]MEA3571606.1 guanylate kinase [Paenibacillus phoenicis]
MPATYKLIKPDKAHGDAMWKWLKGSKATSDPARSEAAAATQADAPLTDDLPPQPKVIIITGTSGSGRKSIAKQLSTDLGLPYVLPYTTRAIRTGERDGEHYRFIAEADFQAMASRQEFSQSVRLERGSYGIAERDLSEALEQYGAAVVVVNHEGMQTLRKRFGPQAIRIFLYVTKEDIRLREEREGAPPEVVEEYLRNYSEQVIYKKESDYLLQNIDPAETLAKIKVFLQDKI